MRARKEMKILRARFVSNGLINDHHHTMTEKSNYKLSRGAVHGRVRRVHPARCHDCRFCRHNLIAEAADAAAASDVPAPIDCPYY